MRAQDGRARPGRFVLRRPVFHGETHNKMRMSIEDRILAAARAAGTKLA
jgi:hypothetical protein